MALPASGSISFSQIRTELGDTGSISYSDLYRGGSLVPNNYTNTNSVPTSGTIDIADFRGLKIEGTAQEKLARFQQYRHSGLSFVSDEGSPGGFQQTSDLYQINNPIALYGTSDTLQAPNVSKSSQKGESQWTTLLGVVAGVGATVSTSSINYGSYYYLNNAPDNEAVVLNHVNQIHRDISSGINFSYTMTSQRKATGGQLFVIPGKWGFVSSTTAASFTLGPGRMAVGAYERGGDGPVGGWQASASPSTGFNSIAAQYWWYNNVGTKLMTNSSTSNQTVSFVNIAEDIVWIFEEIS